MFVPVIISLSDSSTYARRIHTVILLPTCIAIGRFYNMYFFPIRLGTTE